MEIKLQITNSINEGYLRLIMESKKTGPITISRTNESGKYICSRVRYSNMPVRQSSGITLILPKTTLETANSYFIYFSVEDQKKINDFLEAAFYLFFHRCMLTSDQLEIKKCKQIERIVTNLNMLNNDKIFQNLKKSDYRERKRIEDFILKIA